MTCAANVVALDTETEIIAPALQAPPLVCITYQRPGEDPQIEHHSTCRPTVEAILRSGLVVGAHLAFDMAVLCEWGDFEIRKLVFQAYEEGRCTDVQIRLKLLDIAGGTYRGRFVGKGKWLTHKYDLESVAWRCAGMKLQKDAWRLSYGRFRDVPLHRWPERAEEIKAAAPAKMAEAQAKHDALPKAQKKARAALQKEIEGLRLMIASPADQCVKYPLEDATATLKSYLAQEKHKTYLENQFYQAQGAFALSLQSMWGLKTNEPGVAILKREVQFRLDELQEELQEAGLVRPNGVRDTKAAKARMIEICRRESIDLRRTDGHEEKDPEQNKCRALDGSPLPPGDDACAEHVSLDKEACEATGDHLLEAYAELGTNTKILSNDVVALERGVLWPIHTRYDLAETGRVTSSKPNIQNWARGRRCRACKGDGCNACHKGYLDGAREAFIPRPGRVFAQADFPQLELYTLAQCCVTWLGESKLAEALNAGIDPHLTVAALIVGVSYEEAKRALVDKSHPLHKLIDEARGAGKVANFGFPGGLGLKSLIEYAKATYNVVLTMEKAEELREHWRIAWPEMKAYFRRVNSLISRETNRGSVESLFTKRFRGQTHYCAICNTPFQGLGADCAKRAAWLIAKAEYVGTPSKHWANDNEGFSPLFNGRTVVFAHDEFIAEVDDDDTAHDAAFELADLMVEGANEFLRDVPIVRSKMKPTLMRKWSKRAVQRFDERGRLIPWAA